MAKSVNATLKSMPTQHKVVILNDEPDMALSMRSIRKLFKQFQKHVNDFEQQIVVSCHNPYLMELVGEVLSLEHRRTMSFENFKKLMENE